jgi:hypothetical protein
MSKEGDLGNEIGKAKRNMNQDWLANHNDLVESRAVFNQGDGKLLKIASNAGENKGGVTILGGSRERVKVAENKRFQLSKVEVDKVDVFHGLAPKQKDINVETANTLLDVFFDQSRQLMNKVSENYYSQSSSDFLQDTIYYHPALVNKIISEDPSFAGVVCALPVMKIKDEARTKRNKEIYDNVAMCVGIASIFLTAGLAAPIALGVGVGTIAYNVALGQEAHQQYDYANKIYNTTGQLKGEGAIASENVINGYYKEAMGYFQDAVIEGALTPLELNAFVKVLPEIKQDVAVWKTLRSSPESIKRFFKWYNAKGLAELTVDKMKGKLKDYAKEGVKED